jgi:putative RNA 2'-phosphotransferase
VEKGSKTGIRLTHERINHVVATSDKQRFAISDDGLRIRANQGHSITVDLGLEATEPPHLLYHGTTTRNLAAIRQQGLIKGNRQHVHLSQSVETATTVGKRYGRPVVLTIQAGRMHRDGFNFFQSANGVWLTDHIPAAYISSFGKVNT